MIQSFHISRPNEICDSWDIPKKEWSDFRRITVGCPPKNPKFFYYIRIRPHYRKALIQCLKEVDF